MTTDDKIRYQKLQYDINREATKISALSSGKTDKYEDVTGEEILPSHRGKLRLHILLYKKVWKNKQKTRLIL